MEKFKTIVCLSFIIHFNITYLGGSHIFDHITANVSYYLLSENRSKLRYFKAHVLLNSLLIASVILEDCTSFIK